MSSKKHISMEERQRLLDGHNSNKADDEDIYMEEG